MSNSQYIDSALQKIGEVQAALETLVTAFTAMQHEVRRLEESRDTLLKTLASLRSQLNSELDRVAAAPSPADDAIPVEVPLISPKELPGTPPPAAAVPKKQTPSAALVDTFAVHTADDPALLVPIDKLVGSIGANDRFLFAKELFNGNLEQFLSVVRHLDTLAGLDEAHLFMQEVLPDVDRTAPVARQFETLLVRRYMER